MMTISFVPGSCQMALLPVSANAPPDHVIVIATVAQDADTMAGVYHKGDIVRHCHGLMPTANAKRIVEQATRDGASMAQFWYNCGPEAHSP